MELKCLDQFTSSLILASLTLLGSILRFEFLRSVLSENIQDGNIQTLLFINMVVYLILGFMSMLLIYAIVKKLHWLMMPWLVVALVNIICEVIFVIYVLAKDHSKYVLLLFIGTALSLWIISAIGSLFKTIRHENETKGKESIKGYRYSTTRVTEI